MTITSWKFGKIYTNFKHWKQKIERETFVRLFAWVLANFSWFDAVNKVLVISLGTKFEQFQILMKSLHGNLQKPINLIEKNVINEMILNSFFVNVFWMPAQVNTRPFH